MSTGAELIAAERTRQIEQEGYTAEHDAHDGENLLQAAIGYAGHAHALDYHGVYLTQDELPVPWPEEWEFKPGDSIRSLVKAGALIAAAIDNLTRERKTHA